MKRGSLPNPKTKTPESKKKSERNTTASNEQRSDLDKLMGKNEMCRIEGITNTNNQGTETSC